MVFINIFTLVSQNVNEWYELKRVSNDLESIEKIVNEKTQEEDILKNELSVAKDKETRLKQDQDDLRQILELSRRLLDEASKIGRKMNQVESKRLTLSYSFSSAGGRDLRTLEHEVASKMQMKDELSASVSKLNRDLSVINEKMNQSTKLVTENERKLRDIEEKYSKEQDVNEKRNQLNESITKFQLDERRVSLNKIPSIDIELCDFCLM